ncbi:precorrin-2 C20-methyltransferase [Thermodesulfatator indicus DSM 15286]|uniref:Precorrin-2 C20-methyltransferase n=1 Tax=Thermodesulfatator indicus (strain DSM 15286 / JCM 11887 / CIR29812) TaxID=667014 RepID=F8ACC1_THEID|nr:precorrin-2 C(20)-methyltransferase [Thermodesulfatator indicus]AEH45759.1 precorrin-2 C20-methyltransferase [Thermodesulfatator indicus DSM 15286]
MPKLYGVGAGPGDPDLLTLKALKVLNSAKTIFVASSSKNAYSLAAKVVSSHVPEGKELKPLSFPMTYDENALSRAWKDNAKTVLKALAEGDVAFLTMGDPSFYSTFVYLAREIRKLAPEVEIELVPGITAAQAAAARLNLSLAEGDETVLFASGAKGGQIIRKFGGQVNSIILYKVYRSSKDIYNALKEKDLLDKVKGISCCSMPEEKVYPDALSLKNKKLPYFTLFIVGGRKI